MYNQECKSNSRFVSQYFINNIYCYGLLSIPRVAAECGVVGVPPVAGGHEPTSGHRMGAGPGIKRDLIVGRSHADGGNYRFRGGKWIGSGTYLSVGHGWRPHI